jgi:signal transduction histidine kinase
MTADAAPTPVSILLVDDRRENLMVMEGVLRHPQREIVSAYSGNEALRLMLTRDFAVVLLDVQMPDMDGYETAQLMRSEERTKLVPIIFVTAGDRSDERTFRGYEVGAVDFLYKPINARTLRSKVDVFVDLHKKTEELRSLNAALARASAALEEKVGDLENVNRTLSHDLRSPLRSIQGFAAALAEAQRGRLDPQSEDHLGRIVRASDRMARMLDDLQRLLRLGAAPTPAREVDVDAVLRGVAEDLRGDLDAAAAALTHDALPTVRGDATLLAQVLQNLIANALKFRGPEPPRVHVTAEPVPGAWRLWVRDNGVGIAPEYHDKVFGLFQRLAGQDIPGSGVGLALCRRAVDKLGGKIGVESAVGEGAAFWFTVPR